MDVYIALKVSYLHDEDRIEFPRLRYLTILPRLEIAVVAVRHSILPVFVL